MHVIITCSNVCEGVDSKIPSRAPKTGASKPNSDRGKRVKTSTNSPIFRREQHSQTTMNIWTKWTDWHQHHQHALA